MNPQDKRESESPEPQTGAEPVEIPERDVAPVQGPTGSNADPADDAPSQAARADLEPPAPDTPPEAPLTLEFPEWLQAAAATHRGKVRSGNEDRFLLKVWGDPAQSPTVVAAVFDGMGGHGGGDLAAQIACHSLQRHLEHTPAPASDPDCFEALLGALYDADRDIHWRARRELGRGSMGTTAVVATVTPRDGLYMHCGDSRMYHYRNGKALHQTKDHTIVQLLLDHGKITPEEAATHPMRSQLTTCLGGGGNEGNLVVEPTWNREGPEQAAHLDLQPGDVVLLCSDGLCGEISAKDLDRLVADHAQDPQTLVKECIVAALDAGGHDNVTVVALRWGEEVEQQMDLKAEQEAEMSQKAEADQETGQA